MNALKVLAQLDYNRKLEIYRNIPHFAIPRTTFSDKDTNSLTKAIVTCMTLHGFFVSRIDSKGTYNQHLQRFIPSNQKKGLPDIFCQAQGLPPVWIEVKCKATGDRLKPHQIEVIEQLRASGAIVFIAEDFQSFYEWMKDELLKGTKHG